MNNFLYFLSLSQHIFIFSYLSSFNQVRYNTTHASSIIYLSILIVKNLDSLPGSLHFCQSNIIFMTLNFRNLTGILHKEQNNPNKKGNCDKGFEHSWLFGNDWLWELNLWLDGPLFISQLGWSWDLLGDIGNWLLDLVVRTF